MKKVILFATGFLMCFSLIGSPSLSWTCVAGVSGNICSPGQVAFSGTGYNGNVHVNVVKNANHNVYDDFDYDASSGTLAFTETLYPSGTYTITVTVNSTALTQTVTTGSDDDN